jgi:hypothetical protein
MNAEKIERDERDLQIEILKRRLAEAEAQVAAAEAARERAVVEGHLRDAIARTPDLHPAAGPDVLQRAVDGGEWRLDSRGRLMRVSDGQPEVTDTGEYVSPRVCINSLRETAGHLFVQSADQQPGQTAQAAGAKNPWAPGSINVTEQMRMLRSSPDIARQMAAQYGKVV